jgi:hypothetical protein
MQKTEKYNLKKMFEEIKQDDNQVKPLTQEEIKKLLREKKNK